MLANKSVAGYHSDEYREGMASASYVTALKYIRSNVQNTPLGRMSYYYTVKT
jgi:tryptophan synthase alpha subunit